MRSRAISAWRNGAGCQALKLNPWIEWTRIGTPARRAATLPTIPAFDE